MRIMLLILLLSSSSNVFADHSPKGKVEWITLAEEESATFNAAFMAEFRKQQVQKSIEDDTKANKELPQLPYSQRGPYFFREPSNGEVYGFRHIGFLGSFRVVFDSDGTGKVKSSGYVGAEGIVYKEFSKFRAAQHKKMLEDFEQILLEGENAKEAKPKSEQDGAEQPATGPELRPEGGKKTEPESEGRSQ